MVSRVKSGKLFPSVWVIFASILEGKDAAFIGSAGFSKAGLVCTGASAAGGGVIKGAEIGGGVDFGWFKRMGCAQIFSSGDGPPTGN